MSGARAIVQALVCAHPGQSMRSVHRRSNLAWGTVVYHVERLRADGQIAVYQRGRAFALYPADDDEGIRRVGSRDDGRVARLDIDAFG